MSDKIEKIKQELENHSNSDEGNGNKCLIFDIGDETYGIPLTLVKEVIGYTKITAVPKVANYFKGLINLRGQIISVIDFRAKMGLPEIDYTQKQTVIIIAEIGSVVVGTIVDGVREVVNFDDEQIEHDLAIQERSEEGFITGVAKNNDRLTLLLDIGKMLNVEDIEVIKSQAK